MTRTFEFPVPASKLWPFLTDPGLLREWLQVESPGATPVGQPFKMRIKEGGKWAEYDAVLTALVPERHLAMTFTGGSLMAGWTMGVDYRLAAGAAPGTTRLDYACELDAPRAGVLARLFVFPMFRLFGGLQLRSVMGRLRRSVEARRAAA